MFAALKCVIARDLILAMRHKSDALTTVFFFIIVVSLFPLGVGPEKELLYAMAAGVVWVAALLASMLSLSRLFADDYNDGTLEQMLLAPQPLSLMVLGKIIAHWIVSGLPLVIMSPLLGLQFGMTGDGLIMLVITLLLGTPVLSLIGAIGAALTLGLRGGGVLVSLLILPLYIPVLIFGAGGVEASAAGMGAEGHLSLMGAILIMALLLAPLASAAALRISVE